MAEMRNDSGDLAVIQISSSQKNDEPRNVEGNSLDQVNPLSDGTSSNTCCGDKSHREKIIRTIAILWTLTVFVSHLFLFPKIDHMGQASPDVCTLSIPFILKIKLTIISNSHEETYIS